MIKRNFTLLLSLVIFQLIFFVNVNTAVQNYVSRNVDIDRSEIPKNILLGSFSGGRSHLKPILDIAEVLVKRGYNVILLTPGNYTPASEYPAIKQISLGPPQLELTDLKELENDIINKKFDFKRLSTFLGISIKEYKNVLQMYKKVAKDYNIDLFFCDALINDVCLDIGHTLKKPIVGFTSFLNVVSPKPYKSDPVFRCGISLENESIFERFKCTMIRPIEMFYQLSPLIKELNAIRKENGVDNVDTSFGGGLSKVSLVLVDTFFGFELPQSLSPNVLEIGPVLSDEYPSLTPELNDFMSKHKRVLYVAFGTRFYTSTENNDKILQSFVESIDKNLFDGVIWALVKTSKDSFSPTLTLNDGKKIQTSPIINNENPNIRIIKFAPQFSILNHTNTKLFLSHGGAGSSHESLYTGTPMLILPFGGDQMGNGEKLKSSGIALTLSKFDLNVNDILNKMNLLLNDENIKKNVKRLKVLTKINSKRKYRAADLIEYILHSNSLNEGENVNEEFLKEWIPGDVRMGFIRGNNFDVYAVVLSIILGIIGGILWITLKFVIPLSVKVSSKPKSE